ncbi:YndM family protein [Cytobacillus sp. FJAT-54145]|uniref:YndM family protein n=1 Tax=Cytobacillus spartinae TaxID=3299023 RepID=A0ABW6KDX8_9BACI
MKHFRAFAIKFVATFVLLYIILGLFSGMTFGNIFLISLVLGVIAYIVGDMILYPKTNNTVATISDFGLAFTIIWIFGANLAVTDNLFFATFLSAIGVAAFEYFFHGYLSNQILNVRDERQSPRSLQFQTEASEELTPVRPDVRSKEDEE